MGLRNGNSSSLSIDIKKERLHEFVVKPEGVPAGAPAEQLLSQVELCMDCALHCPSGSWSSAGIPLHCIVSCMMHWLCRANRFASVTRPSVAQNASNFKISKSSPHSFERSYLPMPLICHLSCLGINKFQDLYGLSFGPLAQCS